MESGGQRGSSHAVVHKTNYRKNCQLQTLTEESTTGKNHQFQTPIGIGVHCLSYKKLTNSATQPMRNCHHPELSFSTMDFHSKQPLPNPSLFSVKETSFPSIVRLAYSFCYSMLALIALLCYSQLNSFFDSKITVLFLSSEGKQVTYKRDTVKDNVMC